MPLLPGENSPQNLYVGTTPVQKLYRGSQEIWPGGASSISHGEVTFTVPDGYQTGYYLDGVPYIVVPTGTVEVSITPGQSTTGGVLINGAQVNPQASSQQGYDERGEGFNPALTADDTVTVEAGDVIVKTVAHLMEGDDIKRDGIVTGIGVCHIVASAPAASTMAPGAVGWSGRGTPLARSVDLADVVTTYVMPHEIDVSGFTNTLPNVATILTQIAQPAPLFGQRNGATDSYQEFFPYKYAGKNNESNYGRYVGDFYCDAIFALFSNLTNQTQKEAIVTHFLRLGIDWDDAFAGSGKILGGNGGIWQQLQFILIFKRTVFGEDVASLMSTTPGNWTQAIKITQPMIDSDFVPHSNEASVAFPASPKPWVFKRKTILSVSGNELLFNFSDASVLRHTVADLYRLVRESDGVSAPITAVDPGDGGGTRTINRNNNPTALIIDAQPGVPFAADDIVYFEPVTPLVAGQYDWSVAAADRLQAINGFQAFRPGTPQSYRALQTAWGLQVWAADKVTGGLPAEYEAVIGYTLAATAGQFPAVVNGRHYEFWDVVALQLGTIPSSTSTATITTTMPTNAVFDSGAARGANSADIPLAGTTDATDGAAIEVRLVRADTNAEVQPWATVATAAAGEWSGSYTGAERSVHWLKAEVRVQGSTADVGTMAGQFGVGHVWAIWAQSNGTRLLLGGPGPYVAAEAVTHPDDVQIWRISRSGTAPTVSTAEARFVNGTTAATQSVPPGAVSLANTLSAARPGEKFSIIAHTVSGTSPVIMITPQADFVNPSDKNRFWEDEVALHTDAVAYGTQVGVVFNHAWDAWNKTSFNAQKFVPIMTQKLIDGTPVALGDTVELGAAGGESFVLYHSMTELYDLTYTKLGVIDAKGERIGSNDNVFTYTTVDQVISSFENVQPNWKQVSADTSNFPEFLDYQGETYGVVRGVSDGSGGWTDTSHISVQDEYGLPYYGALVANLMMRAIGMVTFDRPEITHSNWTATHIDVWNPNYDITTNRNILGGTSSFVRGFVFDGRLLTTETQLISNAGGSGRQGVRITPIGGVDGSETLEYGRGGSPGLTVGPDDYYDRYVLDLPVMDVGQAKLPAFPAVVRTTFESNLAGSPFMVRDGTQDPFPDPSSLGAGVTGLTIRGEIRNNGAGGTISFGSGNIYSLQILSGGTVRFSAQSTTGSEIANQVTSAVVFSPGAIVPFVWTIDLSAGTTTFWYGDSGEETFSLTNTGTEFASGRSITLLPTSLVADVRSVEVWKVATATRDTAGLGAPHKRIEADTNGAPVQIPTTPAW